MLATTLSDEYQYLNLLEKTITGGRYKQDRTGTGCYSIFGETMRFDLSDNKIPLLTTKKMGIKAIVAELLWFLEGSTNSKRLNELGASIWDEWALDNGDLGPIYGKQWTAWDDTQLIPLDDWWGSELTYRQEGYRFINEYFDEEKGVTIAVIRRTINQIQELITSLKENPTSRRMLVTAWNPAVLPNEKVSPQDNVKEGRAALPACHTMFQVHTRELSVDERLNVADRTVSDVGALDEVFELANCGLVDDDKEAIQRELIEKLDALSVPKRGLVLQVYQR